MIKQVVWDCSVIGREKEFVYLKNEPIRQHYKILQSIPKKHMRMIKEDYGNHQTINDIKQQTIQQTHDYKEQNYDKRNYYKGYRQRILSESNINRNRKKQNEHDTTSMLPPIESLCEYCPSSLWFITNHELQCFCNKMHCLTYSKKDQKNPIQMCDGQILGLIEINEINTENIKE